MSLAEAAIRPGSREGVAAVLEAETSRLEDLLSHLRDELGEIREEEGGDRDGAGAEEDRRLLCGLIQRYEADLTEVAAAQGRVSSGRYGSCEACGARLPAERLEALPEARLCVDCTLDRAEPVRIPPPPRSLASGVPTASRARRRAPWAR